MTTWCRPDRVSSSTNRLVVGANKRHHGYNNSSESYPSDRHQQQSSSSSSRHSIADILGWSHGTAIKIEEESSQLADRLPGDYYSNNEEEEEDGMASECVDVADMVISDEPLDLSLDKSKCRRERDRESSGTPIKRAKVVVDAIEPASDGGTDEGDMDVGSWGGGSVQPHLQMAANFSTVLQYYLTAARLWQTSEVIRCQDQQRAETDSEANEGGDDGHGSDTTPVVSAIAAESQILPVQSQSNSNSKRRKKDHMVAGDLASADSANGSRPRKTRTTFTGKQLFELERIFEQKKYLSSNERQEVARLLNVTGSQIKIWFQNRRTKWKKQDPNTAAELAQLKSASRSQQQQQSTSTSSAPKGKNGSDQAASAVANAADISAGEEINSDDSSPPGQRSPSPV